MNDFNWKMIVLPIVVLFVFIGGIIGIINWQKSKKSPTNQLSVNLPEGQIQSTEKDITITGKTKKGDKVFVNEQEANVDEDGSFSKTLSLKEGENKISIKDERNGKVVENLNRNVNLAAQATTTTAPQAAASASPQGFSQDSPVGGQTPANGAPQTPAAQTPSNLNTSGPEDLVIPVAGFMGIVFVLRYYAKSRKQLSTSLRK